jgi:Helicase conserved C-terminal domain/WYL domain
MSTALIRLVGWLREQPDDELARLLMARPDLLHPVPPDVGALAARLSGRASVEIALDRLDFGALQVVEALCLLPENTDVEAIAGILAVSPQAVQPALQRVRDAVIAWGDAGDLSLIPVARDLLPNPASLGPPARLALATASTSRLTTLAADLRTATASSAAVASADPLDAQASRDPLDVAASILETPAAIDLLIEQAPAAAREAIELLAAGPPIGRVPSARRPVDARTADTPVRWLLAHGLLIAIDDTTVALPREVGARLRGGRIFTDVGLEPPALAGVDHATADVNHTAGGQAFTVVRLVESLLERWGVDPPGVLRAGGLGVRELRRVARELDVDERVAALLIEVAHAAGLVAPDGEIGDCWLPTSGYDLWLAKPIADRWAALAGAWLVTTRVPALVGRREPGPAGSTELERGFVDRPGSPANALGPDVDRALAPVVRREVVRILAEAVPRAPKAAGAPKTAAAARNAAKAGEGRVAAAPSVDSIAAALRWSSPRRGGRLRDDLVGWCHEEAELLGVTGRGALSSFGRALAVQVLAPAVGPTDPPAAATAATVAALLLEPLLPRPLDHVLLQADLTAVAPGPLESELARELAMAADVESTGGATVFRFSPTSIRRALDAGRSATDLHALLAARSRTPVPQPLSYLIDDVARRHGRLRIGAAGAYLRCDDDAVLSEALADRRLESLRLRRLSPTVAVSPLAPERIAERLRELGYAPAAETPDGSLLLRRLDARRAPSRPRPPRGRAEFAAPPASVVATAVRAIRGGDRAATALRGSIVGVTASGAVPQSASTDTLSVLQDAAIGGRAVWIGYLNAQGQASNRIVEPLRLAGGYLTAFDHRRDEVRTFAVHRITGVAELNEDVEAAATSVD